MTEILAATSILERVKQIAIDGTESCEDCPDYNPNPPSHSQCPDFDISLNGKPICKNEGNAYK